MQALASGQGPTDTIHDGLAFGVLEDAAAYFGVSPGRLRAIVRLPTTVMHIVIDRNATLDAPVSKRLWRLAEVALMAADAFEDEEAAKIWLRTENRAFPAPAPLDFLAAEPGTAAVCLVLNAVSTGGTA
jgi:putative toxin-antitoxin system antitoxin component (TIGR02293 family)